MEFFVKAISGTQYMKALTKKEISNLEYEKHKIVVGIYQWMIKY